eukprot:jgi/Tetstr1/460922/TSEL_006075.t1
MPLNWSTTFCDYSEFAANSRTAAQQLGYTMMAPFIFAAAMLNFGITMSSVIFEDESGLRVILRCMGMRSLPYWSSWILWHLLFASLLASVLCTSGLLMGIDMFQRNSFGVLFLLFYLFESAMVGGAYLSAVFIRRAHPATTYTLCVFVVGWICQTVVAFGFPYTTDFRQAAPYSYYIMSLLPWNLLSKGVKDLASAASAVSQGSSAFGISWATRYSYCVSDGAETFQGMADALDPSYHSFNCVMPVGEVLEWLFGLHVVFITLSVILEVKRLSIAGMRVSLPRRLLSMLRRKSQSPSTPDEGHAPPDPGRVDEAVKEEEQRVRRLQQEHLAGHPTPATASDSPQPSASPAPADDSVLIMGLSKTYAGGKQALKDVWYSMRRSEIFCLVGANGAGKTTTLNILTGCLPPSSGDATVEGLSVGRQTSAVRDLMGVCPQFDVLWNRLTVQEHLQLYADIKGVPVSECSDSVAELIKRVGLTKAADKWAGRCSGGMRRRLSVAIALLGNPKIIYLDEPTTGMDPINRRHVWNVIQAAKQHSTIALTTHSLEEADILSDRVAVMGEGRLQYIGSSLRMKRKFGSGYLVTISFQPAEPPPEDRLARGNSAMRREVAEAERARRQGMRAEVKYAVLSKLMVLMTLEENEKYMRFRVRFSEDDQLGEVLEELERKAGHWGIANVEVGLPSLEEAVLELMSAVKRTSTLAALPASKKAAA